MRRTLDNHFDYFCVVVLLILSYVLFFHQLGGIGFVGPDEPRYAAVARGMYESGDYVTPRLLGETWFEKPVLMYWLASLGYMLFGVGETGARLPSALAATAAVLAMFWCGRRLYSRAVGFAAALILATSSAWIGLARAASMDMLLSASLAVALAFFLVGANAEGPERRRPFYLFYAALGVGVLAKGPVAILLPVLALGIFLLWRGGTGEWKRWHLEGFGITALVAAPWYLAVTRVNGWAFIEEFLIGHNVRRFTMDVFGHEQPFWFFLPVFLLMMFPWTFLLVPAVRRRLDKNQHLMVIWALVPFVFFSVSGSKLPAYILPMAAPVALLLAREVAAPLSSARFRVAALLEASLWLSIGVVATFFSDLIRVEIPIGGGWGLLALTVVIAAGVVLIAYLLPPPALAIFNAVTVVGLVLIFTGLIFPSAQAIQSVRPWVAQLEEIGASGESLLLYRPPGWMEYGFDFYLDRPPVTVSTEAELLEATETGARFICISETSRMEELSYASDRVAIEVAGAMGSQTAFWCWQP